MRHLEIFEDDSILEYEEIQLLNMGRNMLIVYHHHQLTLRMVPKKSSTNFWTVPFVDSNRVRKISGMDLGEDVKTIIIIIIVIFVIVIIIIIVIKNMLLTCASEALRLRLSFEDDPASPSGTFERHHPDGDDGDEDDEDYGDGDKLPDNNDDDDGNDDDITRPGKRARAGPAPLGC